MTTPEKNCNQKITRSNTWETLKRKWEIFGYTSLIWTTLLLSSCGPKESDATKISKAHDSDVENVETKKENVEAKEKALKQATINLQTARQELIDAQKQEQKSKTETKQKANNL